MNRLKFDRSGYLPVARPNADYRMVLPSGNLRLGSLAITTFLIGTSDISFILFKTSGSLEMEIV